ncbi:MAG: antitoxin [Streptosporangiales bacterium]|nr:antitoxin [Streptosporangiales bacterium]
MAKTLQVRDLPDDTYAALRTRAAEQGLALSAYVRQLLTEITRRPSNSEILYRAAERRRRGGGGASTEDIVAIIRERREG